MNKNTREKCCVACSYTVGNGMAGCSNPNGCCHNTTENGWEESWTDEIGDCISTSSPENFARVKSFIQQIAKEEYERGRLDGVGELRRLYISNDFKVTAEMFKEAALETPNTETV